MGQRRPCWGPSHQPDDEVTNTPCHPPAARQAQISRTVRPAYTGQETSVGVGTAELSAMGSHPVHCGWGNGSPGFHPVGAGPPTPSKCRQRKHLWAFPTVSWGQAPACEHSCWSRGGWSGTTDVPTGHSYRKHRDGGVTCQTTRLGRSWSAPGGRRRGAGQGRCGTTPGAAQQAVADQGFGTGQRTIQRVCDPLPPPGRAEEQLSLSPHCGVLGNVPIL